MKKQVLLICVAVLLGFSPRTPLFKANLPEKGASKETPSFSDIDLILRSRISNSNWFKRYGFLMGNFEGIIGYKISNAQFKIDSITSNGIPAMAGKKSKSFVNCGSSEISNTHKYQLTTVISESLSFSNMKETLKPLIRILASEVRCLERKSLQQKSKVQRLQQKPARKVVLKKGLPKLLSITTMFRFPLKQS